MTDSPLIAGGVHAGSEDRKAVAARMLYEIVLLQRGLATMFIPFNGSREERLDMMFYWQHFANRWGIEATITMTSARLGAQKETT